MLLLSSSSIFTPAFISVPCLKQKPASERDCAFDGKITIIVSQVSKSRTKHQRMHRDIPRLWSLKLALHVFSCPCSFGKPFVATLARVHVLFSGMYHKKTGGYSANVCLLCATPP
uniref:Uncharacterized protein n=1 Tax=Setaria viridis TaxID=4556 RepID=A0A4U6TAT1_SETVI|nr:hypothetical protein SEVIR_9G529700v2 [Setaria viridis]